MKKSGYFDKGKYINWILTHKTKILKVAARLMLTFLKCHKKRKKTMKKYQKKGHFYKDKHANWIFTYPPDNLHRHCFCHCCLRTVNTHRHTKTHTDITSDQLSLKRHVISSCARSSHLADTICLSTQRQSIKKHSTPRTENPPGELLPSFLPP